MSSAQSIDEPSIEYSSGMVTRSFSLFREYNNESVYSEDSGTSLGSYSYETDTYWQEGDYYVEESLVEYTIEYDNAYNRTTAGTFELGVEMDLYEVEITYGTQLSVLVYALKNATFFMEMNTTYSSYKNEIDQNSTYSEYKIVRRYEDDTRQTLISEDIIFQDMYENQWAENYTSIMKEMRFMNQTAKFTAPMILIYQTATTKDGQRFAWSQYFWEYLIYNDTNQDGFYTTNTNLFQAGMGSEYRGLIQPFVATSVGVSKYEMNGEIYTNSIEQVFPNDTLVEDAFSLIEFSEPELNGDTISWDIKYNNFPTYVSAFSYIPSNPTGNMSYSDCPKANFSYEFDFSMEDANSQLDFTSRLSTIESKNDEIYSAMENLELCLPQMSYFLSSEPIKQQFSSEMSIGSDSFGFESDGNTVAEIDMSNEKKPYTLYNKSDNDTPLTFESVGASVSKLITSSMEDAITPMSASPGNPFCNLVFSIEDEVKDDPLLGQAANPSKLFTIETQNYPTWDGNTIYHDPSFKVYLGSSSGDDPPDGDGGNIGIPNILGLVGGTMMGLIGSAYLIKKKSENK
ncbi:MAG: hypothetical protein GF311_26910 [Candidatus Lokiarchaeota archaeon]|nr:hypothetical protein [Candidatus Lokiarchaeota archaeon]